MLSDSNARLAAARRLTTRRGRRDAGRFLAEGAPAVTSALTVPASVIELFVTEQAQARWPTLASQAGNAGLRLDTISAKAAAALTDTVTPQGVVAVCHTFDVALADVLSARPRLVAALIEPNDPGNAGTIIRSADAAGADAIVFAGGVDPYNAKTVRASAGSLFHLGLVADTTTDAVLEQARAAGLTSLATTATGAQDLDELALDGTLARPTLWLFGSEAHGLGPELLERADRRVRVPIYGRAESLNLAVAAGICLYASAREQRGPSALA